MPHADPVVRREYHKAWKARNRGRYATGQAMYDRVKHANQRAAEAGAVGVLTVPGVSHLFAAGAICRYCGGTYQLTIDHVIPLCRKAIFPGGGRATTTNVFHAGLTP